jgi:hypothetical protein
MSDSDHLRRFVIDPAMPRPVAILLLPDARIYRLGTPRPLSRKGRRLQA